MSCQLNANEVLPERGKKGSTFDQSEREILVGPVGELRNLKLVHNPVSHFEHLAIGLRSLVALNGVAFPVVAVEYE